MKSIFYELIEEASHGKIIIDGEEWPIGFNTTIYKDGTKIDYKSDKNLSHLMIREESSFFALLKEYLILELEFNRKAPKFIHEEEKNRIKFMIAYLFVNATTEDFLHPENLIKRNIAFLKDETFKDLNEQFDLNGHFLDSKIEVKNVKHPLTMETPYKMDISLIKYEEEQKLEYPLASVAYGIENSVGGGVTCYIYSLMKPKRKKEVSEEEKQYEKKIARLLYKLNDGISEYEPSDYFEYKEDNTKFYPENISDVTPSFLLSLIVFLSLLQKKEIHDIKVVPYLPLRYLSRDFMASEIADSEKRENLHNRNNTIQDNATNKFIRTFMRAAFHMNDLQVTSYPYEVDECLTCYLTSKETELNNEILNDIANNICEREADLKK